MPSSASTTLVVVATACFLAHRHAPSTIAHAFFLSPPPSTTTIIATSFPRRTDPRPTSTSTSTARRTALEATGGRTRGDGERNETMTTSTSPPPPPPRRRDRAVDARKSPALWRDDAERSISSPAVVVADGRRTISGEEDDIDGGGRTTAKTKTKTKTKTTIHARGPPELMSPAGGWPQLIAAVSNGADAVYLGLTSYSARARASNFDPDPSLLWEGGGDDGKEEEDDDASGDFGRRLEMARSSGGGGGAREKEKEKEKDKEKTSTTSKIVDGGGKRRRKDGGYRRDDADDGTTQRPASLARAVRYCHDHRVRVYVAFNTLVFDDELREVEGLIGKVWDCGVDAVIVQDVGVSRIVKEVVDRRRGAGTGRGLDGAPLEIHASTQQTVTCADGVAFAAERTNATRVVLGRELSLSEIEQIAGNTDTEIEAFVHGALCVSYSGQCFSSEAWGGRSANRGQCAQACRLPYGLITNGELRHLSFDGIEGIMGGRNGAADGNDEIKYLLSPQDLCGLDQVMGLVKAGVSCLKIEGRLKDASYVAATTRAYRQAIDGAWNKVLEEQGVTHSPPTRRILSSPDEGVSRSDLTHVFARGQDEIHDGLTPGFFEGPRHQRLVRGRSPRHRGMHVGRVVSSNGGALVIRLDDRYIADDNPLKRGDGVVVDRGMPQEKELGGPVYDVGYHEGDAIIRFGRDVERQWKESDKRSSAMMAPKGSHVWKTADSDILKRMHRLAELDPPKSPAKVAVEGRVGDPLTVRIVDERTGLVGVANSLEMGTLAEAEGSAINIQSIAKAVGSLGNSRWSRSELDVSRLEEGLWCPMSWVKDTRRRALENLEVILDASTSSNLDIPTKSAKLDPVVDRLLDEIAREVSKDTPPRTRAKFSVLARNYDQVDAICSLIENADRNSEREVVSEVIIDFLEVEGIWSAVSRIREAQARTPHDLRVVVASPRIIKPGEEGIWQTLLKTNPDGILVRSTGLLHRLMQLGGAGQRVTINSAEESIEVTIPELIGDFSLNVANAITAYELLESGLSRVTASYDLSGNAITELATLLGKRASQLEVVLHTHMPIFHTEHCVFARFLSKGNSYQDCGHVCTRNTVHLRDQNGKDNLVLADMGCRNTIFMAESQTGVFSMNEWVRAGVGHLRIELVDESGPDASKIVTSYLQVSSKEIHANEVWDMLEIIPDSNGRLGGVGFGSLRNAAERPSGAVTTSNAH